MAPALFGEASAIKHFQIRLDEQNIVLRGPRDESASALCKGTLVLCLSDSLRIQGIRLRFTGQKRIHFWATYAGSQHQAIHQIEFKRYVWEFKKGTETLPAGNYEWPFSIVVPGTSIESLEGLRDTHVVYRMKATVERGLLQKDTVIRKPVRIIRALSSAGLEFSHEMSVENTWVNKLQYFIRTPAKAVVFGAPLRVDFTLIPLLKGLRITDITTELVQCQSLFVNDPRLDDKPFSHSVVVRADSFRLPEHAETEDIDGQEGYQFSRSITVPSNLRKCVQSFETPGIKVRHHLRFNVRMDNPDGHTSELHASLPIHIFLSPHLPIDDNHNLVLGSELQLAKASSELSQPTPPMYGQHHLDLLYREIDPSGYNTPASASGVNTPVRAGSRSISAENLQTLGSMPIQEGVPVSALTTQLSQLSTLEASANAGGGPAGAMRTALERTPLSSSAGSNTPPMPDSTANDNANYFSDRLINSEPNEPPNPLSRQSSGELSTAREPQHVESIDPEELAKVPSYSTALQFHGRTPLARGLPSYQDVVQSAGASPIPSPNITQMSSPSSSPPGRRRRR